MRMRVLREKMRLRLVNLKESGLIKSESAIFEIEMRVSQKSGSLALTR